MTKSDDRRTAILDRLADHVLAQGLSASSLRPLAKAAGISDRMLLYYFADKAEVVGAVLELLGARMQVLLAGQMAPQPLLIDALRARIVGVLFDDALWPYMRLWLEIAALAAGGDILFRDVGERIGRGFLAWGAAQLDSPSPEQREIDAARLLVSVEGMVLIKSIGMADICRKAL